NNRKPSAGAAPSRTPRTRPGEWVSSGVDAGAMRNNGPPGGKRKADATHDPLLSYRSRGCRPHCQLLTVCYPLQIIATAPIFRNNATRGSPTILDMPSLALPLYVAVLVVVGPVSSDAQFGRGQQLQVGELPRERSGFTFC